MTVLSLRQMPQVFIILRKSGTLVNSDHDQMRNDASLLKLLRGFIDQQKPRSLKFYVTIVPPISNVTFHMTSGDVYLILQLSTLLGCIFCLVLICCVFEWCRGDRVNPDDQLDAEPMEIHSLALQRIRHRPADGLILPPPTIYGTGEPDRPWLDHEDWISHHGWNNNQVQPSTY